MNNQSTELMLPCKFAWSSMEIPPRCRKARTVYHTKEVQVPIKDIPLSEVDTVMPLALVVHDQLYKDTLEDMSATHKKLYLYQGSLYEAHDDSEIHRVKARMAEYPIHIDKESDIESAVGNLQQEFILRGGTLCSKANEPIYRLEYGFTSGPFIMVHDIWDYDKLTGFDFRADELEYAIDAALHSEYPIRDEARDRLLHVKENSCYIEVLLPEALKMPSYLNRIGQRIEQEVISSLKKEFHFTADELEGTGLVEKVMAAVYSDKELKSRRYLYGGSDIVRIIKSVFLGLLH